MPELPEVETIKRNLESKIKGKKISSVEILWPGILNVSPKEFISAVKGAKITDISRRAKVLMITLSNNFGILIHLKLTGQLIYDANPLKGGIKNILTIPNYKHARVIFEFKDGDILAFNDIRKFAYLKLMPKEKINEALGEEKFGPEPLSPDFTLEKFKEILAKHPKRAIKQLLMDQAAIAGIGNIYSDEICFYAKVLPTKRAGDISEEQIKQLYRGIKTILLLAIKLRGSSIDTYVDAFGQKGSFVKEMKVYDRENEKCFGCPGKVKRIKLGGRSSYFCPSCQR